jgi:hypothetical protein
MLPRDDLCFPSYIFINLIYFKQYLCKEGYIVNKQVYTTPDTISSCVYESKVDFPLVRIRVIQYGVMLTVYHTPRGSEFW